MAMHVLAREARAAAVVSPYPVLAVAWAVGILAGSTAPGEARFVLLAALVAALLCLVLAAAVAPAVLPIVLALCGALGGMWSSSAPRPVLAADVRGVAMLRLVGAARARPDGWQTEAILERFGGSPGCPLEPAGGERVLLRLPADHGFSAGDRVVGEVRLRAPRAPDGPGTFDAVSAFRRRGVVGVATPVSTLVPLNGGERSLRGALDRHRQKVTRVLGEQGRSGVLAALALGQGDLVDDDVRHLFGRSGVAHVLAVSGLHFGLVALVVLWFWRAVVGRFELLARRFGTRRLSALLTLPVLACYVVYVGAPVSAQRAFVMAACLLGGEVVGRKGDALVSLSLAALILLAMDARAVFGVGFQLSFAAVLGLVCVQRCWSFPMKELVGPLPPLLRRLLGWLLSALGAAAGAAIATTPFVLLHFGAIPVVGNLANLWVVPAVSFVLLPMALTAAALAAPWPTAGSAVAWAAARAEDVLVASVAKFDAWAPLVQVDLPGQPGWVVVLYGIGAYGVLCAPVSRLARTCLAGSVLGLGLWYLGWLGSPVHEGTLRVTFIAVGQGDARLIEFPDGRSMLVDAGGVAGSDFDPGERIVVPFLRALGRRRLDWVVITHADHDHVGGAPAVVRAMRPRVVWVSGDCDSEELRGLREAVDAVGAQLRVVGVRSPPLRVGGAEVRVLWPDEHDTTRSRNDNSVVLRIDYGAISFVLPGDAEHDAEAMMLDRGVPLQATVLAAGHHGSRTSSSPAFLDAVRPQFLVLSVGEGNRFGFPHAEVLSRARERNMNVLRTDYDGSIRLETDGASIRVETFKP